MTTAPLFLLLVALRLQEPPARIEPGQTCLTCHQALTEGHNSHRPVREALCSLCHLQADASDHRFTAPAEPGKVCTSCHELPARSATHAPVAQADCLGCHTAHHVRDDPFRRFLLAASDERELCARCHEHESGLTSASVHAPILQGGCLKCHVPHTSHEPKLLRKPLVPKCAECHAAVHAELEGAVSRHPPVGEDCLACHDQHASAHPSLLREEPRQLCQRCHGTELAEYEARPFAHGALTSEQGCANCHAAHVSSLPKLLLKPVGELCLSCHAEALTGHDGRTIQGLARELASSVTRHGPIAEGACDACHEPHGAHTFALLREPYSREFYRPFQRDAYALCFGCHDAQAFTAPESAGLTRFRDGSRNLHALHVNQEKGRTCRACHTTHASTLPAMLAESVPFGQWSLPLRFERTPSGGACTPGCHARAEYRTNPFATSPAGAGTRD